MVYFRIVFGLLLSAALACFAAFALTGQLPWRRRGLAILKWTLLAAFGFFAVLIGERIAELK